MLLSDRFSLVCTPAIHQKKGAARAERPLSPFISSGLWHTPKTPKTKPKPKTEGSAPQTTATENKPFALLNLSTFTDEVNLPRENFTKGGSIYNFAKGGLFL